MDNTEAQNKEKRKNEIVSIGKNSFVYALGRVLSHAIGFLMIPVYTRFIAPAGYGSLEMIEIITAVIATIISVGSAEGMSRFYYARKQQEDRNMVVSTVIIGLGIGAIPIVLLFLSISGHIAKLVVDSVEYQYFFKLSIVTAWFGLLCEFGYTYLRMLYKAKLFIFLTTIQLIVALSLNIWFVVFLRLEILGIFYSTLISQGIIGLVLSFGILRHVGLKINFDIYWEIVRFGIPLIPSRIGLMIGFLSNRFFLRWLGSADPAVALAQIGLFSLGHKFGVIVNRFVSAPLNSYWGPRRLELILGDDMQHAKQTIATVCTYAFLCSTYAALMLSVGIENVIQIMADKRYLGAHIVVPFVALSYVALALENQFNLGIIYKKKTKWATYITLFSLLIVLGWNYLFIPKWGIIGAATSNLAGFSVRLLFIYLVSQMLCRIPYELWRLFVVMFCAVLVYLVCYFVQIEDPYLALTARLGIASIFPLYLYLLKFYTKEEIAFAKELAVKVLSRVKN